jgi:WD40 repeat protein
VRAAVALLVVGAACSGRDARTAEERAVKQPTRLEVIVPEPLVNGTDVTVSPVDASVWATRVGLDVFVHDGKPPRKFEWADFGSGLSFSRDGAWLYVGIHTYDPATGRYRDRQVDRDSTYEQGIEDPSPGYSEEHSAMCFDPTARIVRARWHAASREGPQGPPPGTPGVRLLALDEQLRLIADLTTDIADSITFSDIDCSKRWVVVAADQTIVWDRTDSYRRVTPADAALPRGTAVAIAPDDSTFAVAGTTVEPAGVVSLVDPATSKVVARADSGVETIFALAFSPDGRRVAVGGADRVSVLRVDGATLTPLASAEVAGAVITGLAFEPDGNALRAVPGGYRLVLR